MNHGDLENLILHVVERYMATRYHEKHAIVTSYDPDKHLAKAVLQPGGQETGWLQIERQMVGNTYGIVTGLQPGQGNITEDLGESSGHTRGIPPSAKKNQGDQVIVRWQEGDIESGKISQLVHSDVDKPPSVKSGELLIYTKFQSSGGEKPDAAQGGQGGTGQQIYFKNDGSITFTDGNGASLKLDGNGGVHIIGKLITIVSSGDAGLSGGGNVEVAAGGKLGLDAGSTAIYQGGGSVSDGSVSPPSGQPSTTPFQVP